MHDPATHWNQLHANPRFRPVYPNEDVVRFLMRTRARLAPSGPLRLLDIAAGAGRHMRAAGELGFSVFGIDISFTGLSHAHEQLQQASVPHRLVRSSMHRLPFADASFDAVVSYGAFCYGVADDMRNAVRESFRVLKNHGTAFVVLRSTSDYRCGKGRELEPRTFQLDTAETNELGTVQHFLREEDIPEYFSPYSRIAFEKAETTFEGRTRINSDWLITAEK